MVACSETSTYEVTGTVEVQVVVYDENGFPYLDTEPRTVWIESRSSRGVDPTQATWILIHGWNGDPADWANDMAQSLVSRYPEDTVLTFDWSELSNTGISNPDLSENRIEPAATWLAGQLSYYQFSPENLNFIGHSHGAYVSNETAELLTEDDPDQNVSTIIALDPAANVPSGYNPDSIDEVTFRDNAVHSWAFVDGDNFNVGSSIAAATAHSSFVVRNASHSLYQLFQGMLDDRTNATQWFVWKSSRRRHDGCSRAARRWRCCSLFWRNATTEAAFC